MGDSGETGKEVEESDGERYASPHQRRAFEEGRRYYGDFCHRCHQSGHWQSECPQRWQAFHMACYECGSYQHSQDNCPDYIARARLEAAEAQAQIEGGGEVEDVDEFEPEEEGN